MVMTAGGIDNNIAALSDIAEEESTASLTEPINFWLRANFV
jgi:hypothetical protein